MGKNAIYVSETDPNELKRSIETLLLNIDLRIDLINRGLMQSEKFSYHKTAQDLQNSLLKCAEEKKRQSSRDILFRQEFRALQQKLQASENSDLRDKKQSIRTKEKYLKYFSLTRWISFTSRMIRKLKK
jgi:hypothetical protein